MKSAFYLLARVDVTGSMAILTLSNCLKDVQEVIINKEELREKLARAERES